MHDVVGADELTVIANTGDDVEIYGAYVSPDPDLVTFWLADRIDERGWGLDGDTFNVMDGLRELGVEVWFNLGDRDLAVGLERARALDAGLRLTEAQRVDRRARSASQARRAADERLAGPHPGDGAGPVVALSGVHDQGPRRGPGRAASSSRGAAGAAHTRGARGDRDRARDRDRPVEPGHLDRTDPRHTRALRDALASSAAPVVAVSPLVGGEVVKGPTGAFMEWAGQPPTSDGIAAAYGGSDRRARRRRADGDAAVLETDVLMDARDASPRVARRPCSSPLARSDSVSPHRCGRSRSSRSRASPKQSSAWRTSRARRPAGARRGDVLRRARRAAARRARSTRSSSSRATTARSRSPAATAPGPRRRASTGTTPRRGSASAPRSSPASSGCCSSPATARCSIPGELDELIGRDAASARC